MSYEELEKTAKLYAEKHTMFFPDITLLRVGQKEAFEAGAKWMMGQGLNTNAKIIMKNNMTKEEKALLLKELCARLPYGVKFKADDEEYIREVHYIKDENVYIREYRNLPYCIDIIKPYLRPISSMTEEEVDNLFKILKINEENGKEWLKVNDIGVIRLFTEEGKDFYEIVEAIDYLYERHIDFRGLIEKGLALEATEGMYKTEKL